MLLPISVAKARSLSLENHLVLVALRTAPGNIELIGRLFRTLYVSYFVHVTVNGHRQLDFFRMVESLLHRNAVNAKTGQTFSLADTDADLLAQLLKLHDRQLASMPSHYIDDARDRLVEFLQTEAQSPIPAIDDKDT